MMTITLNLTNWVKSGMIPTATEVPMDATGDIELPTGPTLRAIITHAC
jgi:hypothetical protein